MTTNGLVQEHAGIQPGQPPAGVPPPPLVISGVVVSKSALLQALAVFLPQIQDIRPLDDEQFVQSVGEG